MVCSANWASSGVGIYSTNTELLTIEVMYGIVAVVYTTELFGNGRFCLSATLSLPLLYFVDCILDL